MEKLNLWVVEKKEDGSVNLQQVGFAPKTAAQALKNYKDWKRIRRNVNSELEFLGRGMGMEKMTKSFKRGLFDLLTAYDANGNLFRLRTKHFPQEKALSLLCDMILRRYEKLEECEFQMAANKEEYRRLFAEENNE